MVSVPHTPTTPFPDSSLTEGSPLLLASKWARTKVRKVSPPPGVETGVRRGRGFPFGVEMGVNEREGRGSPTPGIETDINEGEEGGSPP